MKPYRLGVLYFVETVTKCFVGKLVYVGAQELVLEDVAWVADTGRYHIFLANGRGTEHTEVEPLPDGPVVIGRGALVMASLWKHGVLRGSL